MGGEGSGRHKDPVKRLSELKTPIINLGEPVFLPNLSGVKTEIKSGTSNITTDDLTQGSTNLYSQWVTSGAIIYLSGAYTKAGIGTAGTDTVLHIQSNNDDNNGLLKLQVKAGASLDNAGITFWDRAASPLTNARNWQISNNWQVSGNLDIMRSTTNIGNPTTVVMSFDLNGNVGIGPTGPEGSLQLASSDAPALYFQDTAFATTSVAKIVGDNSGE